MGNGAGNELEASFYRHQGQLSLSSMNSQESGNSVFPTDNCRKICLSGAMPTEEAPRERRRGPNQQGRPIRS